MTPTRRAALLADVAAICIESMLNDAPAPQQSRSHARKRHTLHCRNCGDTKRSCNFVRVCRRCGGLMGVQDDNRN